MGRHIKRLITLTSDYIKRLSLYVEFHPRSVVLSEIGNWESTRREHPATNGFEWHSRATAKKNSLPVFFNEEILLNEICNFLRLCIVNNPPISCQSYETGFKNFPICTTRNWPRLWSQWISTTKPNAKEQIAKFSIIRNWGK